MPVPAPLFRDPIYDGAADPTIIWNRDEKAWWLLYTNRRANVDCQGVAWVHGTDIGIASSVDGCAWRYRGTLQGLEFERGRGSVQDPLTPAERGRNTFWAPEVLWHDRQYHMYVSYVRGVPPDWSGERHIVHMVSANLWDWQFRSILPLSSDYVIDACVFRLPGGNWRMWYKDEAHQSHTYTADSPDLEHWIAGGPAITDCAHEGPNVFAWRGAYWMVTDWWRGLGVYRSDDLIHWSRQADILNTPGSRPEDGALGHHADVLVQGEQAYIFYFTHPEVTGMPGANFTWDYHARRTSIQAAMLDLVDGQLVCHRDQDIDLKLEPGE